MHEHLDDFGLINMNGRVFDPAVAQFLSPDEYIQNDGNWLNFNRYAYCVNNPLKYTDPSGEIVWELVALSFVIGATLDLGVQVANYMIQDGLSFKDAFSSVNWWQVVLVGAISGVAGCFAEELVVVIEKSLILATVSSLAAIANGKDDPQLATPEEYCYRPPLEYHNNKRS